MERDYSKHPLGLFLSFYKSHRLLFAVDIVCSIMIAGIDLIFPLVSKKSMQVLLPDKMFRAFFIVMSVMALAYVIKGVFYYAITAFGTYLSYFFRFSKGLL